jgi:hypothetical protein
MKEKKKRNRKRDEPQTLEAPPAVEDDPVTPAVVTQGLRAIDQIPRRKRSRLAWLLMTEHTCEGEAFRKRITSVTDLTPKADQESFMRRNWEVLCISKADQESFMRENREVLHFPNPDNLPGLRWWHPDAAMVLLKKHGFWFGGSKKWYEKWRTRFGLTPCTCDIPRRTYSVTKLSQKGAGPTSS